MRDVHERNGTTCYHDEPFDSRHSGDVQRHEFSVGERKLASPAGLEKPIPCGRHRVEYGIARWDIVHPVLQVAVRNHAAQLDRVEGGIIPERASRVD